MVTKINLCVLGCPPAPVYKGARGEAGRPLGCAKEGGDLLLVGVGLPFPSPTRKGEGGRKEGEGESYPLSFLSSFPFPSAPWPAHMGGTPAPCGWCVSPLGPYLLSGVLEPLPVTRYVPGTLRNTFGVRILSSYISIFTARPF